MEKKILYDEEYEHLGFKRKLAIDYDVYRQATLRVIFKGENYEEFVKSLETKSHIEVSSNILFSHYFGRLDENIYSNFIMLLKALNIYEYKSIYLFVNRCCYIRITNEKVNRDKNNSIYCYYTSEPIKNDVEILNKTNIYVKYLLMFGGTILALSTYNRYADRSALNANTNAITALTNVILKSTT
jgi:hypothetical protein